MVASGDVSDYDSTATATILQVLSTAAGLPTSPGASLTVSSGSVSLLATLPVASLPAAEAAMSALSSNLASAADFNAELAARGLTSVSILSSPSYSQLDLITPRTPPASPPQPLSPPGVSLPAAAAAAAITSNSDAASTASYGIVAISIVGGIIGLLALAVLYRSRWRASTTVAATKSRTSAVVDPPVTITTTQNPVRSPRSRFTLQAIRRGPELPTPQTLPPAVASTVTTSTIGVASVTARASSTGNELRAIALPPELGSFASNTSIGSDDSRASATSPGFDQMERRHSSVACVV